MSKEQIENFIQMRKNQLAQLNEFWCEFQSFNKQVELSSSTFEEVKNKYCSQVVFLLKSIESHQKQLDVRDNQKTYLNKLEIK
jgi:hypothetical protein